MRPLPAAVVLAISPAGGVILLLLTRLLNFGEKGREMVKGIGNAAATSFMWCSVVLLFQELLGDDTFVPLMETLAMAGGPGSRVAEQSDATTQEQVRAAQSALFALALGVAISVKIIKWVSQTTASKSMIVAAVMFLHTAAEGAAIGLSADRSVYSSILFSLAIHNIPEGFVVAVASLDEMGVAKCTALTVLSHLPQPIAMFLMASSTGDASTALFKLPFFAEWLLQGLSLGSIAGTCYYELVPEALQDLGRAKGVAFMLALFALMYNFA